MALVYPALRNQDSIRLLRLEAAKQSDERLVCFLFESEASGYKTATYEALSYTWGALDNAQQISCNDTLISVAPNLFQALRRLRSDDEVRIVWIDALCINQADDAEKTVMVRKMSEIYANATRVSIWLGEDDESNQGHVAFDLLAQLSKSFLKYDYERPGWLFREAYTRSQPWWPEFYQRARSETERLEISPAQWSALGLLLQRGWFYRVWVIQEAVLPGSRPGSDIIVRCGSNAMQWEDFIAPIYGLRLLNLEYNTWGHLKVGEANTAVTKPFSGGINMLRVVSNYRLQPLLLKSVDDGLWNLLTFTKTLDSTDPRDKTFALMGLLPLDKDTTDHQCLLPDYSCSVTEAYVNVALFYLQHRKSLRILEMVPDNERRQSRVTQPLPSWVPDWSIATDVMPLTNMKYAAAGHTSSKESTRMANSVDNESQAVMDLPDIRISTDRKTCTIRGKLVSKIDGLVHSALELSPTHPSLAGLFTSQGPISDAHFVRWVTTQVYHSCVRAVRRLDPDATPISNISEAPPPPSNETLYAHTRESLFEAFWRTLIFNRTEWATRPESNAWTKEYSSWHQYHGMWQQLPPGVTAVDREKIIQECSRFDHLYPRHAPGRCFFIAGGKFMGWAPQRARAGDFLCVFAGSDIPHVLRECNGDDQTFELIGGAYIHGLMDGEAMQDSSINLQDITLV